MGHYLLKQPTAKKASQVKAIPGREKDMMRNNAGGFAFKADSFDLLQRFLILGSANGSYYVTEQDLTSQNVDNVRACIAADGFRAVKMITDISVSGRAPKNDPALYALALAASYGGDEKVRAEALRVLPQVARIGTHLFTFVSFVDSMRGWGSALKRGVGDWYSMPIDKLAYQLVKYQQRNGWSHRDILRLTHPHGFDAAIARWVLGLPQSERAVDLKGQKSRRYPASTAPLPDLINAFEMAKSADEKQLIELITTFRLTREMIPTQHQKSPAVWEALFQKMPLGAMVRTLGRMGACGLLAPLSTTSIEVCRRLHDPEALRKAKVHPISVLAALLTYKEGRGQKGSLTWQVVPQVVDALNDAFYLAFEQVEPTGKRFYLGIDVSGSMTMGTVAGLAGLTPNMGAAAMAMLIARTEPNYFIGGFSDRFVELGVSKTDRLDAAMRKCQMNYGGTDASIAITHAQARNYPVDAFVVISDGESWAGSVHASQALEEYRRKTGIDAKLIVINMVANRTRVGDPTDPGTLDIVGFDASVPPLIAGFLGAARPASVVEED